MRKKPDQSFYDMPEVQSATECTGLMPAMPPTEEGAENLSQLMAIHCPPCAMPGGEEAKQWEQIIQRSQCLSTPPFGTPLTGLLPAANTKLITNMPLS